jgi:hypothetical protein
MKTFKFTPRAALFTGAIFAIAAVGPATADTVGSVSNAVNFFQNGQATGGAPMTVDAKGPVTISDDVDCAAREAANHAV